MNQINCSGNKAASHYPDITYWTYNWRKDNGSSRMYEIAKHEKFYKQEYCGCAYSLRDTNAWRLQNNQQKITLGTQFFSPEDTLEEESEEAVNNFFAFYPSSEIPPTL